MLKPNEKNGILNASKGYNSIKINCFSFPCHVAVKHTPHTWSLFLSLSHWQSQSIDPLHPPNPNLKQIFPLLPLSAGLVGRLPFVWQSRWPTILSAISPSALWVFKNCPTWHHFTFRASLRKVNYGINHVEGQAKTSLQVLNAYMNIFHFWLTQYVTIAVRRGRKEKRNRVKKESTLLNWCTTHVSASWLGRKIRGRCRKICFLQQCPHFSFNSEYSGVFLTGQNCGF